MEQERREEVTASEMMTCPWDLKDMTSQLSCRVKDMTEGAENYMINIMLERRTVKSMLTTMTVGHVREVSEGGLLSCRVRDLKEKCTLIHNEEMCVCV